MPEEYSQEIQESGDSIRQYLIELKESPKSSHISAKSFVLSRLSQIDLLLSAQLNEIIHYPDFRKLEAAWRGLYLAVNSSVGEPQFKYLLMTLTKKELMKDFEKALSPFQTSLCKKISDMGSPSGAMPFGALIGNYEFSHSIQDVSLLRNISEIAQHFYSPFIASVAPQFFGSETFKDVRDTGNLHTKLKEPEYSYWNSFRDLDSSRFIGLCLPQILFRLPYSSKTHPTNSFRFEEDFSDSANLLYGNPAFAFAERIAHFYQLYRWCAKISGFEETDFPQIEYPEFQINAVEETPLNNFEIALSYFGFIPMNNFFTASQKGFINVQSCERPDIYETKSATLASKRKSSLPCIFALSRFAHNLVGILKDRSEIMKTSEDRRHLLQNWLDRYVITGKAESQEFNYGLQNSGESAEIPQQTDSAIAAKYPLSQAFVEIIEDFNYTNKFTVIAKIKPHFQLDELPDDLWIILRYPYF